MNSEGHNSEWSTMHAALQTNRESLTWQERQKLATSLADQLSSDAIPTDLFKLLNLLAVDPKWEVRKAVAALLSVIPNDYVVALAGSLCQDSNGFVRKSAERAMSLRRRGPGVLRKPQTALDYVIEQSRILEGISGPAQISKVRELALQLYDVSVGSVVHDLRGVLTSAQAKVSKLQSELKGRAPDTAALVEGADKVAARLRYLEQIVEAMDRYSKGILSEKVESTLVTLIDDAQQMSMEAVDSIYGNVHQIRLTRTLQNEIRVLVARHELVVAIANVIKNAYEAIILDTRNRNESGEILLMTENHDETVQITVRDNGMGLSEIDLKELRTFVPGRTSKKGFGTGFGLAISQRYISAHGGSLAIESTENVGTTVVMTIPILS